MMTVISSKDDGQKDVLLNREKIKKKTNNQRGVYSNDKIIYIRY